MFSEVRERAPITAATPELLAALARLAEPADTSAAPVAEAAPEPVVEAEADVTDSEFEQLLNSLNAVKAEAEAPVAAVAAPTSEDITDAEFESLLDQLHGKGQFAADAVAPAAAAEAPAASSSTDITDDEFEALLDQLHGKGTFVADALPEVAAAAPAAAAAAPAADGLISDHEFESLLDELHGKGKFTEVGASASAAVATPAPVAAKAPAPVAAKPAPAPAAAAAPARAAAPAPAAAEKPASEAETTVRVDTARLDDIMNMVGELVLVRNRLVRLGLNSGDEAMQKAVSNLDVVTADLQTAVKRADEQAFALANGQNLMFCEDAARRLNVALKAVQGVQGFNLKVVHAESLHSHDAVAESRWNWKAR